MPQNDDADRIALFNHIEAVIASHHFLLLKLAEIKKPDDIPTATLLETLKIVSRDFAQSKTRLDDEILRLEKAEIH